MIKNLSQLKRSLKENMLLEITGHCRAGMRWRNPPHYQGQYPGLLQHSHHANQPCQSVQEPHPLVEQGAILEF